LSPEEQAKIVELIVAGKVAIMPTDTIYGIVGQAVNPAVVERIYQVKDRKHTKPFVVLVSDYSQLEPLGTHINSHQKDYLETIWPGPVSVVIPTDSLEFLHRGTASLAVRMPKPSWLKQIIDQTGPIVATSANLADGQYVHDLSFISQKFQGSVDYISKHKIPKSNPSRIINIVNKANLR